MAVKSKKVINFSDGAKEVPVYLPVESVLTKDAKETADNLDRIMESEIEEVNMRFQSLDDSVKKNQLSKWKWWSVELKKLIQVLRKNGLKDKDIKDNIVWIPIGQYLCDELSCGTDTRRAGTHKDHYRKVYLLSEIEGLNWINSWSGWDAFADRGDAILQYPEIFSELEKVFSKIASELEKKDYQYIAKKLVEYIPMSGDKRKSVSSLSSDALSSIAQKIFVDYQEKKKNQ